MSFSVDPLWLIALLLAFVRAAAWLVVVPPFSNRRVIPSIALVAVAGGLAVLAAPHMDHHALPTDTAGLIGAVVLQAFTGIVLGLPMLILFSAVGAAGGLIDQFGGINLPPSLDPLSENQTPIIGQLYEQVAMALLFISNGELLVVRGFVASFGAHGLTLTSTARLANMFTGDLATFFVASLEMAAPLIIVLFATQVALALLAKAAPQMNVWMLGFPLQVLLSLVLVTVGVKVLPGYLANIVSRVLADMGALVGAG